MTARRVAAPPEPFRPAEDVLSPGTRLYRVYQPGMLGLTPVDFHPGTTPDIRALHVGKVFPYARFSFFLDDAIPAAPVPALYAATTENVALWETVLRDRRPQDDDPITGAEIVGRVLARVRVAREIRVASLAGADMHRLDLPTDELTFAESDQYDETIPWAKAAWEAGFDAVKYVSHRDPSGLAYVFFPHSGSDPVFEQAIPSDVLYDFDDTTNFGGFAWLAARLARWGIDIAL